MRTHFVCAVIKTWVWIFWGLGTRVAMTGYILLTWGRWDAEIPGVVHKRKATGGFPDDLLRNSGGFGVQLDPLGIWSLLSCFLILLRIYWATSALALPSCQSRPRSPGTGIALQFSVKSQTARQPLLSPSVTEEWNSLPEVQFSWKLTGPTKSFCKLFPLSFLRLFRMFCITTTEPFNWNSVGKL